MGKTDNIIIATSHEVIFSSHIKVNFNKFKTSFIITIYAKNTNYVKF